MAKALGLLGNVAGFIPHTNRTILNLNEQKIQFQRNCMMLLKERRIHFLRKESYVAPAPRIQDSFGDACHRKRIY